MKDFLVNAGADDLRTSAYESLRGEGAEGTVVLLLLVLIFRV